MQVHRRSAEKLLDLNVTGASVRINVEAWDYGRVAGALAEGAWGTAVLTVYGRVDDGSRISTGQTIGPGSDVTDDAIDCVGFAELEIAVTTPEGAAGTAKITGLGKSPS